jgi:signal transduction histidine kinase
LPRWTLRLRLTLLYGALFLATGAVLLAITYALVSHSVGGRVTVGAKEGLFVSGVGVPPQLPLPKLARGQSLIYTVRANNDGQRPVQTGRTIQAPVQSGPFRSVSGATLQKVSAAQRDQLLAVAAKAAAELGRQRQTALHALLAKSAVALGIMALVSIALGWVMAGRALRPVRTMGLRARGISERNLHQRLALEGPNDELKELGDTFDGLLARLESAFESQRRFVANASHELRTPITVERTLVEVALADPGAGVDSLRATCERVLAASEQQEQLIEALLTLARSQRGLDAREELDLGEIAGDALQGVAPNGVRVESTLGEARTTGDPALVERLVANLVDNALHYNVPSGWIQAWTGVRDGTPTLRVANSGPVIPPERAASLIEPFRRLDGDRNGHHHGLGLGLSIVDAIAVAHGAELHAAPRAGGGLEVEVRFPTSI